MEIRSDGSDPVEAAIPLLQSDINRTVAAVQGLGSPCVTEKGSDGMGGSSIDRGATAVLWRWRSLCWCRVWMGTRGPGTQWDQSVKG